MSFIQFESATEKEKIRQELREVREQLLEKAKKDAHQRKEREVQKQLKGETNWMLPAVSAKIDKLSGESGRSRKTSKKEKKQKKKKSKSKKSKKSKKRKHDYSTSESDSSSEDESATCRKSKKSKKLKKKRSRKESESSSSLTDSDSSAESISKTKKKKDQHESSSESDNWVERQPQALSKPNLNSQTPVQRDSWMTDSSVLFKTYARDRKEKEPKENKSIDSYDPAKSTRELNPYWKSTGTGLPAFKKPKDDSDGELNSHKISTYSNKPTASKSWRKTNVSYDSKSKEKSEIKNYAPRQKTQLNNAAAQHTSSSSDSEAEKKETENDGHFLTDQQMNELGAKLLKAEIMGNMELANELKAKLEHARKGRQIIKQRKLNETGETSKKVRNNNEQDEEHILLTHTDEQGNTRPLAQARRSESKSFQDPRDLYGGRKARKQHKRAETHAGGERVRYFPDDDKYDIKQMFEREKTLSAKDSIEQFIGIAGKHKNPNDDLDDIFADKIRKEISESEKDKKEVERAISKHQILNAQLDNCTRCLESQKMDKKLIVSMGDKVYLALPWYIGLQAGHCIIVPTQHISCSTQLDEDAWEEINNFRKALTRMFAAQRKDVIFYEIANKLHKRPHLSIHCIPIPESKGEMAPFYFKKAIEESEREWSVNKQLVSLRDKGLRSSIPKGLPYVWVNCGMSSGFAHVIEDQDRFPQNFAQEIIGGILQLDTNKWRKPQKEQNAIAKVKILADWWKKYDCTEQ